MSEQQDADLRYLLKAYGIGIDTLNNRMNTYINGEDRNVRVSKDAVHHEFEHMRKIARTHHVDEATIRKINYIESLVLLHIDKKISDLLFMIKINPYLRESQIPPQLYNKIIGAVRERNRRGL